jgi:hypothetical protein
MENLPWYEARSVQKQWDVFQVNARDERQQMEKLFHACTVLGAHQYNNGANFNDIGNVQEFFIAFESTAGTLNLSAVAEYAIKEDKYQRKDLYTQSRLECTPIEEELFVRTSSEGQDGQQDVLTRSATKHTNYAGTSFTKRIEILLKFFAFGRYKDTCTVLTMMRDNQPLMMKSEYRLLKDSLTNAYKTRVDDKSHHPAQVNAATTGHDSYGRQGDGWCVNHNPPPSNAEKPCTWFITAGKTCYKGDLSKVHGMTIREQRFLVWWQPAQGPTSPSLGKPNQAAQTKFRQSKEKNCQYHWNNQRISWM